MSHLRVEPLFAGRLVRMANVVCGAPRSSVDAPETVPSAQIVFPRRGVFTVHRRGGALVADGNCALVLGAGEEYRVSHPADGGDECTVLAVAPELHEEAFGDDRGRHGRLGAAAQLRVRMLPRSTGGLDTEEAALLLLGDVVGLPPPPPGRRRYVEDARALLAADPTARWDLDGIARAVHCSPFHLARQFRAATGETLSHYLLRLRLALAVERIAGGERNLARLALDLGFAHHSHFTARFRAVFGTTPSQVRRIVTAQARAPA